MVGFVAKRNRLSFLPYRKAAYSARKYALAASMYVS